jgi:hypothetical protein
MEAPRQQLFFVVGTNNDGEGHSGGSPRSAFAPLALRCDRHTTTMGNASDEGIALL